MSLKSFLWPAAQFVLPSTGTSCIQKDTAFGLRFELIVSLWRERWWFFLHLSQVVPPGFLQSFVRCSLRHLQHLLFCFTTSHLWFTVELRNSRQAAKWSFHAQPNGHASWSGVLSLLAAWFSVLLKVGPRWVRSFLSAFSLSGLPLERRVTSWCSQVTRFDTFSSFPLFASLFQSLCCLLDQALIKAETWRTELLTPPTWCSHCLPYHWQIQKSSWRNAWVT